MGTQGGGEPATCACGAAGVIINRAPTLDVMDNWYIIEHEGGVTHTVEVYWTGEAYRFRMKENR